MYEEWHYAAETMSKAINSVFGIVVTFIDDDSSPVNVLASFSSQKSHDVMDGSRNSIEIGLYVDIPYIDVRLRDYPIGFYPHEGMVVDIEGATYDVLSIEILNRGLDHRLYLRAYNND